MSGGSFTIDPKTGRPVRVGEPLKTPSRAERRRQEREAAAAKRSPKATQRPAADPKPAAEQAPATDAKADTSPGKRPGLLGRGKSDTASKE